MIFLGPNKTKTIFMIFFYTKHRLTDILGRAAEGGGEEGQFATGSQGLRGLIIEDF